MASKEDKLLAALRSLSPPRGGAGGEAPRPPERPQPGEAEADVHGRGRARRRSIELSLEEAGVFFLAAIMLVILAFLMGWYGRGVALPGAGPGGNGRAPGRGANLPRVSMDEGSALRLGERRPGVRPLSPERVVYTILAANFPGPGGGEAADYEARLREHGFVPAFRRETKDEAKRSYTELCVGRFASQTDPVLVAWLPRVRRLHEVFAKAVIAQIPDTAPPPDDTRIPFAPGRERRQRAFARRPEAFQAGS